MAFERAALAAYFAAHPEGPLRYPVTDDVLERDFVISHVLMLVEMDELRQEQETAVSVTQCCVDCWSQATGPRHLWGRR